MDGRMLTRDQVEQVRAELTMGDLEAARADAGQDMELLAKVALRRRAAKLGIIPEDTSTSDFLDMLRVTDVTFAFSDQVRNPLSAGIGSSPASSDTSE